MARALAYSYVRFSTPDQLKGDSLRRQLDLSERYAKEHDLDLREDLQMRDLGLSAFSKANVSKGALGVFLEVVKRGQVPVGSYLLVESLDRLSRAQVLDALQQFIAILQQGITIVTLADNMVYSEASVRENFASLLISITIMSRAHEESLTKSKRLKASWEGKRQKLEADGTKLTAKCPGWLTLNADRKSFTVDKAKVKVIKQIFKWVRDGKGLSMIERELNEKKIPNFGSGQGWHKSYLTRLVNSRTLLGEYHPYASSDEIPTGEPILGYYPAVLTEEEFNATTQVRVERRGTGGRKSAGLVNLLSGLCRCGYCGGAARFISKSGDPPRYYLVCSDAKRGRGCHHVAWAYSDVEASFLRFCRELDVAALIGEVGTGTLEALQLRLDGLRGELAVTISKRDNLMAAIEDGGQLKTVIERLKVVELKAEALESEIAAGSEAVEAEKAKGAGSLEAYASLQQLTATISKLSGPELADLRLRINAQLRRMVEKIELFPAGSLKPSKAGTLGGVLALGGKEPDKAKRFMQVTLKSNEKRIITADGSVVDIRKVAPEGTRKTGKFTT